MSQPPAVPERSLLDLEGARPKLIVACGLIDRDGRTLLATRPAGKDHAGLWEFPGGKVEAGETPESALIRELHEELGVRTEASCLAPFSFVTQNEPSSFILLLFLCRKWSGTVVPREGQMTAWVAPGELLERPMPPADLPLGAQLRDFLLGI